MSTILDELTKSDPLDKKFTDEQMGTLGDAVNSLLLKQHEIIEADEALKDLKRQERMLNQDVIPMLMENLGFESITVNGKKVSVKDSVQVSIPAAQKPGAFVWMDENGHGDLIKIALTAKFARGQSQLAGEAFNMLMDIGVNPNQTEAVHPGTLKAWAREELSQGHSLPQEFFKIHVVKLTTVK